MNQFDRQNPKPTAPLWTAPQNVGADGRVAQTDGTAYSYGMGKGAANQAAPNPNGYVAPNYAGPTQAYNVNQAQNNYGAHAQTPYANQPQTPYVSQSQAPYANQPQTPYANQAQYAYAQQPVKKKKPASFWIAIVVAVVCVVLAVVVAFTMFGSDIGKSQRQGTAGQLENKTPEEIQAELNRVVEEGMFNISIASVVQFENGSSEGDLRIENVPGNHYLMRVIINRDDTGEQIYQTDFIEPNFHIQKDTLDVVLPAGRYPCTATFFAYDMETEESVGQAAAKIDINVLN